MKTDISQLPFTESKHALGVFLQMGRLQLESDWNEQTEISLRREQRLADDVAGIGSPNEGFRVDNRILLDAMDSTAGWTAEKQVLGDPAPQLFVDSFDFRTGSGSLVVEGAVALARKLDRAVNWSDLREVVFAVKVPVPLVPCNFFLGSGGTRGKLTPVEDPAPAAGWRVFRAAIGTLNPAINLAAVDEYGFTDLTKTEKYTFDYIKIDEPIRVKLVPTERAGRFTTTSNPGDTPALSISDDNRFWRSTVLKATQATSVTSVLPVVRDLSRMRRLIVAVRTSTGAAPVFTVTVTDATIAAPSVVLAAPVITNSGPWEIRSYNLPQAGIDWTQVKSIRWSGLAPATTYLFAPVLAEMSLDGNLVIVGGDGTAEGAGRFYGDGLAAIKESHETYFSQVDLPEPDPTALVAPADGQCRTDLAYLDLWERAVTYIEDPDLREIALEGPDTCTRTRLIAQVRLLRGTEVAPPNASQAPMAAFAALPRCGNGTLTTKDDPAAVLDPCADPCEPEVTGTFLGEENRLFRVEIHKCGNIGPAGNAATATFKWSRENGAVATGLTADASAGTFSADVEKPELFHQGDLIEISDDLADLITGPFEDRTNHRCHERGELRKISAIDLQNRRISWQDAGSPEPQFHAALVRNCRLAWHGKLRRWDGVLAATSGDIVLADGVVIELGGSQMVPGDFWVFKTRVVDRSVERLIDEPPRGCHRYYPLATITRCVVGGQQRVLIDDLRPHFDPLTGLTASGVSFDSSLCKQHEPQWELVSNVQQAIDALCRMDVGVDLREHNKHVHGYGVVCGLKVRCHANREQVSIGKGYALDCEGHPIRVRGSMTYDIVQEATAKNLLDNQGDGDVCITLTRGAVQDATLDVEAQGAQTFWNSVLEGTLLKDFYEQCIKNILTFLSNQFLPIPATTVPVPDSHKRLVSFLNLLFELFNPATGQYVWLSLVEHQLLLDFYNAFKALIASKTFCGMFDAVSPFPAYPYLNPPGGIFTAFGLFQFHRRMRMHPGGRYIYTCDSFSNTIQVFDLDTRNLVELLEFPAGANFSVKDVAFSPDGTQLHAVGILNNQDSIFATATIGANQSHTWGPTSVVCDILFVTLARHANWPNSLYAIGQSTTAASRGLFNLNPAAIPVVPVPTVNFHATGIFEIAPDGRAFAAENSTNVNGPPSGAFNRFRSIDLNMVAAPKFYTCAGADSDNDMAVVATGLYITGNAAPGHVKTLYRFDIFMAVQTGATDLGVHTPTRLAQLDATFLLVSLADHHKLVRFRLNTQTLDNTFRVPQQLYPFDLLTSTARGEIYALNFLSNTISVSSVASVFAALQPPYTLASPITLSQYRQDIINAFADLLSKFVQYLKDCFCDKFLIECKDCGPNDKIYLGCVHIQQSRVYNICNFTKRKYVKSVKNWEYWLSTIPVIDLFKFLFGKFCCKVL